MRKGEAAGENQSDGTLCFVAEVIMPVGIQHEDSNFSGKDFRHRLAYPQALGAKDQRQAKNCQGLKKKGA